SHDHLGPLQRWMRALRDVVLGGLTTETRRHGEENTEREHEDSQLRESLRVSVNSVVKSPEPQRIVLFIDEIDTVRGLPFSTDEFFAAIRQCYNLRAEDPEFERLTFCLLGVASPTDLIRDSRLTPFNIGTRIELTDFTGEEALPLAAGLGDVHHGDTETRRANTEKASERTEAEARRLLRRVLYWTGGHPYLTQRL